MVGSSSKLYDLNKVDKPKDEWCAEAMKNRGIWLGFSEIMV